MAYLCKQKLTVKEQYSCGTCAINNFVYGIEGLNTSSDEDQTGELYWQLDYLQKLFTKLFNKLVNNVPSNNNKLPGETYFQSLLTQFQPRRRGNLEEYLRLQTVQKNGKTSSNFITAVFNDEQSKFQLARVEVGRPDSTRIEIKKDGKRYNIEVDIKPPTSFDNMIQWIQAIENSILQDFLYTDRIMLSSKSLLSGAGHKITFLEDGKEWYLFDSELKQPVKVTNRTTHVIVDRDNNKIEKNDADLFNYLWKGGCGIMEMLIDFERIDISKFTETIQQTIEIDMTLMKLKF